MYVCFRAAQPTLVKGFQQAELSLDATEPEAQRVAVILNNCTAWRSFDEPTRARGRKITAGHAPAESVGVGV